MSYPDLFKPFFPNVLFWPPLKHFSGVSKGKNGKKKVKLL